MGLENKWFLGCVRSRTQNARVRQNSDIAPFQGKRRYGIGVFAFGAITEGPFQNAVMGPQRRFENGAQTSVLAALHRLKSSASFCDRILIQFWVLRSVDVKSILAAQQRFLGKSG